MADSAAPPPPTLHGRPRATPYRCLLRLRDRLELALERFVDGDPTAQAGFERYKADRDRRWAETDASKKNKKKKKVPAAGAPESHVGEGTGLDVPKTRDGDKGKGKEKAPCPGDDDDDDDDDDDAGRAPGAAGGSTARRYTGAPRPRAFSSLVGSTLGEQRRRKRKRSDARPGYFDPDPFPPQEPGCGAGANAAVTEVGDEDRLEMNVPVELGRRSWAVPIGTAR